MTDVQSPNPRRKHKSRSGCLTCKRRRIKCDENIPSCRRCIKIGVECPGYTRPMKWSTKYEKQLQFTNDSVSTCDKTSSWFEEKAKKASDVIACISVNVKPNTTYPRKATSGDQCSNGSAEADPSIITSELGSETPDETIYIHERDIISTTSSSNQPDSPSLPTSISSDSDAASDSVVLAPYLRHNNPLPLLHAPIEQSSILLDHYFSLVCRINSCFDSIDNPFRSEVSGMIVQSPLVFYCVLSMSAAHLYQHEDDGASISLGFQTEAISHLSSELAALDWVKPFPRPRDTAKTDVSAAHTGLVKDEVLLGIILLGMTSAWHDVTSLGLSHLHGSRPLFKAWMSLNALDDPNVSLSLTHSQSFILSSMVYWEAMASFLVDQDTEVLSYLDRFLCPDPWIFTYPSPWTGVGTPIFICLAKAGTLLRKKRTLRNLEFFKIGNSCREELYSELVSEARTLEQDVLKIRLPFTSLIEDIGDIHATPDQFHRIARCYRLGTLLELYRAFPDIVEADTGSEPPAQFSHLDLGKQAQLVLSIAFSILSLLESIPDDSSTTPTHNLILLIVGSALAQVSIPGIFPPDYNINQEISRGRQFVRDRVCKLHKCVGLRPITHVAIMLEEVWTRMDLAVESGSQAGRQDKIFSDQVHWMDVMLEKRLETILG